MIFRLVDRLAAALSIVSLVAASAAILALIGITMWEVGARYLFNAPTIWAFDLAWMLNGAGFMLGAAFTLRAGQHVAIDVFSEMMPRRLRKGILAAVLLLLFLPAILLLADAAWEQTARAYLRGEVERVSPWKPLIWPFRAVLLFALVCLAVETVAQALRAALVAAGRDPGPVGAAREAAHG